MGVSEEQSQRSPRHAHRRISPRRGALIGLLTSLAILVSVPVTVGATRPDPSVGSRTDLGSMPGTAGVVSVPPERPATADPNQPAIQIRSATPESPSDVVRPTRVRVDSVGIDAAVDPTGVLPDGTVVIPRDAYRVGWYRYGPAPGSRGGSAVLVGHVDSRTQGPGALYSLRNVQVGDRVVVTVDERAGQRRDIAYRVVARELMEKQRLPFAELFARSGPTRLTLITCGGAYVPDQGGYQENLVVTAVPIDRGPA